MTRLLPRGLISIHDAALIVQDFSRAGTPESPLVRELRSTGLSVGSREEQTAARAQIREWILSDRLKLHATGGVRGIDIILSAAQVGMIPGLRTLESRRPELREIIACTWLEFGGVVSVFNLESSGVGAPERRPRHDKRYHEV